jgi:anaphase-promoting complex subunit 6
MKNELYLLAHKLAESAPKSAFSWYAVGCYYFLTRSWQNARLYFGKATALKREFGAAWLAYGYTFAQNGDHDQALSAYRTAARLLVGSHLPTLFIATELTRAKDTVLALEFAKRAAEMQPNDPYPIHELGVIHYRCREYPQAIACFQRAINLIGKKNIDEVWESTIFNLGQAHMKLSHYESAIEHFEWSLALLPHNASTYSALAVAHHVLGNLSEAIELYHQVLSITPDDAFATDALEDALHEWVVQRGTGLLQEGDVELDMSE